LSKATLIALEKLESIRLRNSSKGYRPHHKPVPESWQRELQDAEVTYNYCLYYPLNEKFHNPSGDKGRTNGTTDAHKINKIASTKKKRVQIWNLVEQCMVDGTLQDLRDGKIWRGAGSLDTGPSAQNCQEDSSNEAKQVAGVADVDPDRIRKLG